MVVVVETFLLVLTWVMHFMFRNREETVRVREKEDLKALKAVLRVLLVK